MIGKTVVWRIFDYIELKLENLKDSNLRNSRVAAFIKEYSTILSLILSFVIIAIGIIVISSSLDRTISNEISIQPRYGTYGSTSPQNDSHGASLHWFNPENESKKVSLLIGKIIIGVEYKEPLACGDNIKVNGIKMLVEPDAVKDVKLQFFDKNISLDPKNGLEGEKRIYYYHTFENLNSFAFNQYNGDLIVFDKKPYDNFELNYLLEYSSFEYNYSIEGIADPKYPIRCMDYATETNVNISKLVLRLTGALIILGAFPFVAALKQLLEKDEDK